MSKGNLLTIKPDKKHDPSSLFLVTSNPSFVSVGPVLLNEASDLDYSFQIGTQFRTIVNILSIFGSCPLSFNEKIGKYEFRLFSWRSLFTLMMSFLGVFGWILYISDMSFGHSLLPMSFRGTMDKVKDIIQNDPSLSQSMKSVLLWFIALSYMMTPLEQTIESIFGWFHCMKFATFLNNWSSFEAEYNNSFSSIQLANLPPELRRRMNCEGFEMERNYFFFRMKPSNFRAISIIGGCTLLTVVLSNSVIFSSVLTSFYFMNIILRLITLDLLADAKAMFMYRDVAQAFARIRVGIAYTSISSWGKFGSLTGAEVKAWRKLVQLVRSQCELVGAYQKPGQLNFFAISVVSLTLYTFIVLNIPRTDYDISVFSSFWTMVGLILLVRIYGKVWMAERISLQESRIADELSKINSNHVDSSTLLQIKFTHDLISQNSSRIHFGSYVNLDRGLLFNIFNQVVSYLIVIMQFIENK